MPLEAIASHDRPQALPQRNLLRQLTWSLPSGQAVAKAVGATPLAADDLAELKPYGFQSSTPLWYYVLKEAQQVADGLHLGPVGGRIVAEVLIGLLETDSNSYLARKPKWKPTLPSAGTSFRMKDFLIFAGRRPDKSRPVAPALPIAVETPADADDRLVNVPMPGMSMVTTSPSRRLNDSSGTMLLPVSSTAPTGKVSASPDGSHTPLILLASQRTPSGCRES